MIKLLQGYIPTNSAIPLILGSILFTPLGMKMGRKYLTIFKNDNMYFNRRCNY